MQQGCQLSDRLMIMSPRYFGHLYFSRMQTMPHGAFTARGNPTCTCANYHQKRFAESHRMTKDSGGHACFQLPHYHFGKPISIHNAFLAASLGIAGTEGEKQHERHPIIIQELAVSELRKRAAASIKAVQPKLS